MTTFKDSNLPTGQEPLRITRSFGRGSLHGMRVGSMAGLIANIYLALNIGLAIGLSDRSEHVVGIALIYLSLGCLVAPVVGSLAGGLCGALLGVAGLQRWAPQLFALVAAVFPAFSGYSGPSSPYYFSAVAGFGVIGFLAGRSFAKVFNPTDLLPRFT